jgi:hypothetical protein
MAEAIAALYERDLERMGAAARERVLRQFTWHKAFQMQTAAYASLLGTRPVTLSYETAGLSASTE